MSSKKPVALPDNPGTPAAEQNNIQQQSYPPLSGPIPPIPKPPDPPAANGTLQPVQAATPMKIGDKLGLRLDEKGDLDLPSLAYVLVQSGMFPDVTSVSKAIVKIMVGREIGVGAMQSVINIHVIRDEAKNRTSIMVGAHTIGAKIKGSGRYDYDILQLDSTVCELQPYNVVIDELGHKKRVPTKHTVKFTIEQAKKAKFGGWNGSEFKEWGNWGKDPESMLFARAISRLEKQHFPDLTGLPVYTPDELGFRTDETGEAMVVKGHLVPDDIPPEDVEARIKEGPAVTEQKRVQTSPAKFAKLKAIAKQKGWTEPQFFEMVKLEDGFTDATKADELLRIGMYLSVQQMIADENYDKLLAAANMEPDVYHDGKSNPPEHK